MLSELDEPSNLTAVQNAFAANRSSGGLWALAIEPGVQHAEATVVGNQANVNLIATMLAARLPATLGDPLIALDETAGWLGNQTTFEIATWAAYTGNRATASWLLNQSAALSWQTLSTPVGGGGVAQPTGTMSR
jgi:hypothetical protein